jgi:choline dehydrogenase-like flavoprotein
VLTDLEPAPPARTFQGPRTFHSDVCILGAGIAGLTVASRLAARGLKVHLLEAGGLTLEPRSQALYAVEHAHTPHAGATQGRFRLFGGSSTRWGGQLLPYTPDVFRPEPGMPSAPWPISSEDIELWYPEVLRIMGLPPRAAALPFDAPGLLAGLGRSPVDLGPNLRLRYSKWAPFNRRNLARSLGRDCLRRPATQVFLHANALSIEASAGRAAAVLARNYAGDEFRFTAGEFVLALGTIESARLLLASRLGNEHDQLGRYFHDHVSIRAALVEGPAREQLLERLGPFVVDGVLHTAKLEAAGTLRATQQLPAVMAHLVIEEPEDSGIGALRATLRAAQRGDLRSALQSAGPMLRGLPDVVHLAYASRLQGRRTLSRRARLWLHIDMEQPASPQQRITLSDSPQTRDSFGQPPAVVHWRAGAPEQALARRYAPLVRDALASAGFGGLRWLPGALDGSPEALALADTFHPMGGLRMGTDAHASVVTPDLALHGTPNLHVASCAVFPSGGSSNPTFTLIALALRLANRLADSVPDPVPHRVPDSQP